MNAVDRLRVESDKSIGLIGESPRQDWELGFRVHPKVSELPEYAPFIAAKNELTALQYPHIAEYLSPENEMGLTPDERVELIILGQAADAALFGGELHIAVTPELRCQGWAQTETVNPFFDRLRYEYSLTAGHGGVILPEWIEEADQIRLDTPWGTLTPLDEELDDRRRLRLTSFLWTDEGRRFKYKLSPNKISGRLEFTVTYANSIEDEI